MQQIAKLCSWNFMKQGNCHVGIFLEWRKNWVEQNTMTCQNNQKRTSGFAQGIQTMSGNPLTV